MTNNLSLITLSAWHLQRKKLAEIPENSTTHELVIDLQEISLIRALFSYIKLSQIWVMDYKFVGIW